MNEATLHMLGYLTEDKWIDAFKKPELSRDALWKLVNAQEQRYNFTMSELRAKFKEE